MRAGECVKKGFGLASKSLPLVLMLLLISVLFNLASSPITLKIQNITQAWGENPNFSQLIPAIPLVIIFVILSLLLSSLTTAGSLSYIKEKIKTGKASLGTFFVNGSKLFLKFFVFTLITVIFGLAGFGLFLLSLVPGGFISALSKGAGAGLWIGMILTVILMIAAILVIAYFAYLMLTLAPFVIVDKESSAMSAVKDSMRLVKGKFWPLAGLLTILALVFIAIIAIVFLLGLAFQAVASMSKVQAVNQALQFGLGIFFSFVFMYFDVVSKSSLMNYYFGMNTENTGGAN